MGKKVFIVDDDKTLTKILQSYLHEQGYEVVVSNDGAEALAKLEHDRPDLLVLDVVMPKMNGYTFLFEMRKFEYGVAIPVIVLTCKEEMADIFKVEGVREYLIKPFPNKDLLDKIKKHI
jgi:DNA-binding response OmpR family regulator